MTTVQKFLLAGAVALLLVDGAVHFILWTWGSNDLHKVSGLILALVMLAIIYAVGANIEFFRLEGLTAEELQEKEVALAEIRLYVGTLTVLGPLALFVLSIWFMVPTLVLISSYLFLVKQKNRVRHKMSQLLRAEALARNAGTALRSL